MNKIERTTKTNVITNRRCITTTLKLPDLHGYPNAKEFLNKDDDDDENNLLRFTFIPLIIYFYLLLYSLAVVRCIFLFPMLFLRVGGMQQHVEGRFGAQFETETQKKKEFEWKRLVLF